MNDWQSRFEFSKMMNKEETIKAAWELSCDIKVRLGTLRYSNHLGYLADNIYIFITNFLCLW